MRTGLVAAAVVGAGLAATTVAMALARRRRRSLRRSVTCTGELRNGGTSSGSLELYELPTLGPAQPSVSGSPGLALTRQTVELISESMPVVGGAEAARIFYTELFTAAPELKQLFGSPAAQHRKLAGMLKWVDSALQDVPSLSEGLRALGERHLNYSANLAMFHAVKGAFMQMVSIVDQQAIADRESLAAEFGDGSDTGVGAEPFDRHQRLVDVRAAWEALLFVFIGEMSPIMLMEEKLGNFHTALANDLAAPSGGTCVALAGAQGAALLMMSAQLTTRPRPGSAERAIVDCAKSQLAQTKSALETLARLDMGAHCRTMAAIRQPALEYPAARLRAISTALEQAARVPLQVAEWALHALKVGRALLPIAALNGVGDAGAGVQLLSASARAALHNISINTGSKLAAQSWRSWATGVDARAAELAAEIDDIVHDISRVVAVRNVRDG